MQALAVSKVLLLDRALDETRRFLDLVNELHYLLLIFRPFAGSSENLLFRQLPHVGDDLEPVNLLFAVGSEHLADVVDYTV